MVVVCGLVGVVYLMEKERRKRKKEKEKKKRETYCVKNIKNLFTKEKIKRK